MVTLTHPANWGPYKRELFAQVPGLAGLGEVRMLTEPEAAAAHYARNDRLDPGALVAVYDLGGGTFDATVLRTTEHGFDILGRPEGIEGLGGIDFDEAVFTHVDQTLDGAVSRLDPADPRATSAAIRLRHECVTAKETLSADTETTIPVLLPELQTEVRLTRGEFERMIRPAIDATIASLRRALQSAQIDPAPAAHRAARWRFLAHPHGRSPGLRGTRTPDLRRHPPQTRRRPRRRRGGRRCGRRRRAAPGARLRRPPHGRSPPADPVLPRRPRSRCPAAARRRPPTPSPSRRRRRPRVGGPGARRFGWWRGRGASSSAHDGGGHPGQDARELSDDRRPQIRADAGSR